MSLNQNLIASPAEREQRVAVKRHAVLRFLRQHLWSTRDILQEVMKLGSRQAAHRMLVRLEQDGLLNRHLISAVGGNLTIWGITPHGQGMAFNPQSEAPVLAYFEPSKVSEQRLRHQLDTQRLRLAAEKAGWTNWTDGDRLGAGSKDVKRPDAIAIDCAGVKTAIECERTLKTSKRYEKILVSYLQSIKSGTIGRVVWVSPDTNVSLRVRTIITGIHSVSVAGQRVQIDPQRHHAGLVFTDYAQWPHV